LNDANLMKNLLEMVCAQLSRSTQKKKSTITD